MLFVYIGSLACSVQSSYILLCGFPPVFGSPFVGALTQDDDSDAEALEEVLFPDAYWSNISSGAKALLRQMLHPDPASRVTAKEAQQDRWIQSWVAPPIPLPPTSPLYAPVDMNLVRSKLYKSLEAQLQELPAAVKSTSKRRHSYVPLQDGALWSSRKRAKGYSHSAPHLHRSERRASTTALMALADLYRGVTAPSVIAAAAAAAATAEPHERSVVTAVTTPLTPDGQAACSLAFAASLPLSAETF
jgi:serine/threonine protein kinase